MNINFLLLDEPTNHLDLPSREAVESALKDYPGTLLFVCHDRYFLEKMADEIWELRDGNLHCYPMSYGEYIKQKQKKNSIVGGNNLLLLETRLSRLSAELNQCCDDEKKDELNQEFLRLAREINRIKHGSKV